MIPVIGMVQKLRRIRSDVADEIKPALRRDDRPMAKAAVKARDALNDMLIAVGDEETARVMEKHYSLDEMTSMTGYSGVGCPRCGIDADVEGCQVEIDESAARQEVVCSVCDRTWVNRYKFDGEEKCEIEDDVSEEIDFDQQGDVLPRPRLMVLRDTTHAFHRMGDLGRPESDRIEFITVSSVKKDFFVGNFVEGFGFFNVHFPRDACGKSTVEEREWLASSRIEIGPFPATGAPKRGSL